MSTGWPRLVSKIDKKISNDLQIFSKIDSQKVSKIDRDRQRFPKTVKYWQRLETKYRLTKIGSKIDKYWKRFPKGAKIGRFPNTDS